MHRGQALLVSSGPHGDYVIAAIGDRASALIAEARSKAIADIKGFARHSSPRDPGFHVWEGVIFDVPFFDPVQIWWEGDWRLAHPGDFERFDCPAPRDE